MAQRKAHQVWIEQCEAAQTVRARFGTQGSIRLHCRREIAKFCQCRLDTSRVCTRAATVRFRGEADVHAR
jgi:hypothetical protein